MSYIINNSRGQVIAVVADGTINTTATSLSLVGRGINGYGESENENYVFLLENFAASTAPQRPIPGQLWYNTATNSINIYNVSNTWETVPNVDYVQAQKISPVFTGIPQAPTAPAGTANAQIATTEFVSVSPQFSGIPTAPTAPAGTATTQIATTAFVTNSPQFSGTPTVPTGNTNDNNLQIANKEFVQAQKFNTALLGVPTAPTAPAGTANVQIATTAFVSNSPQFNGVPTAPTAAPGTANNQIATTEFVTNSPQFSGVPTAPTATLGTANDQIATTLFVNQSIGDFNTLGSMSLQNANAVNISGGTIGGIVPLAVSSGGTAADTAAGARANLGVGTLGQQDANAVTITGGEIIGITPIRLLEGGTGATTASQARINLGLGTLSLQPADQVTITGGLITGITDLAVADGGTGASSPLGARQNLGIGTIATQDSNSVEITGGNISGVRLDSLLLPLPVGSGGTGAVSPSGARNNLGLGDMATQNSSGIFISGGTITGISPLAISSGGTSASDAAQAMRNLLPEQFGQSGKVLSTDGFNLQWVPQGGGGGGSGTVTSVTGTGSANGLTLSGVVTTTGSLILSGAVNSIDGSAITSGLVTANRLGTGTANASTWLRGDNSWQPLGPLASQAVVPVANGGTGAITAPAALVNLGLGGVAYANKSQTFTENNNFSQNVNIGGNVGIGTVLPLYKLHVYSGTLGTNAGSISNNLRLQVDQPGVNVDCLDFRKIRTSNGTTWNSAAWRIQQKVDVTDQAYIQFNGTDLNYGMAFGTSDTEQMRIDANGRFFVGRTTQLLAGAKFTLDTSAGASLVLGATFNTAQPNNTNVFIINKGTANYEAVSFRNNTSFEVGRIDCTASSTAFLTSSDYRIKDNIAPLADATDRVSQLNPVSFTWTADGSNSEGFIAHEVAEIAPYAVHGEKDAVNSDGTIKPQCVDYSKLVPVLTAALQDAIKQIKTLEQRVAELENRIVD